MARAVGVALMLLLGFYEVAAAARPHHPLTRGMYFGRGVSPITRSAAAVAGLLFVAGALYLARAG